MDLGTPKATKALGGISLLAVAAASWVLAVGPQTSKLNETRAEVESARQQNEVLTQQLGQLRQQRTQLTATRQDARRLAEQFPPTADQPGLFREVTEAAVAAGIGPKGVTTLAPTPPVIGGTQNGVPAVPPTGGNGLLASQTVSVSVTGSYDQTQTLLENLEHMPRAFLIDSVSLSGGEGETGAVYTTTITGQMFVMPPVTDPGKTLNMNATTD
jgi:Tfp pilus assembly protein PilO